MVQSFQAHQVVGLAAMGITNERNGHTSSSFLG